MFIIAKTEAFYQPRTIKDVRVFGMRAKGQIEKK